MFEALFVRALRPDAAFADELRDHGFDVAHVYSEYPTRVWCECIKVARRRAWASSSDTDAWREMGRAFVNGYLDTLTGKLIAVAVPFLSPEMLLKRMERYLTLGRSDLRFVLTQVAPKHMHAELEDPYLVSPDFLAGMLLAGFERLHVSGASVEVKEFGAGKSELEIRWG
jgi:uncharacterized protein (TIGR02265 family)